LKRRDFLQRTAAGGVLLTVLPGCGNQVTPPPLVEASVDDDPTDKSTYGLVRLSLVTVPDLALVGAAVTVRLRPLEHPDLEHPFKLPPGGELLVAHRGQIGTDDEWIALDSACPHAGCPLAYSAQDDQIQCPCHSSQFRAFTAGSNTCVGQVMHSPSKQDAIAYQVALDPTDQTILVIDLKQITGCNTIRLPPVVGGKVTLQLADFPALAAAGGSVIGRPAGSPNAIAVVRVSDANDATAIRALSAVCTHLGCTVAYAADGESTSCGTVAGGFWCSCHCSQFAIDGKVLVGPADKPLPSYAASFDGSTVTITIV
jgi:Rieske Fe-S protein